MEVLRLFAAVLLSLIAIRTSHTASIGSQNGIRLSYGYTQNEGLVEVLVREDLLRKDSGLVWGTVCFSGSPNPAIGKVICRQLGYKDLARFKDTRKYILPNHDRVALRVRSCQGTEFKLEECEIEKFPKSCKNDSKLAVVCAKNGSVRFEDDSLVTHSGVVEAYINQRWEDVCTEQTVTRDRLCRQLGFSHSKQGDPILRSNQRFAYPNWTEDSDFCNNTAFSTEGCVSYDQQGVRGVKHCGKSDLNVTCVGPIGKVGLPRVDDITATAARIHWSIPDLRNVQNYHFIVAYWEAGGNRNNKQEVRFKRVSNNRFHDEIKILNLKSNTEYYVEVVASDGSQAGEFSEPVMFKTKIARPSPPKGLTIDSNNGMEVVLTHQGQSLPNGSRLEVQYQSVERGRQCVSYKTVPDSGRVTLDDLRPNTNYSAKVRVIQQVDGLDIYSTFSDGTVTFAVNRDETIEKPDLNVKVDGNVVNLSFSERTRRQIGTISTTPTTSGTDDVIILGITCALDPIGERRQYYWEDPYTSDLVLGNLPHNIKGTCSVRLHTSYGSSDSSDFYFNTSEARITHPPELLSPEITDTGKVRISWVIPQGYQPFGNITESIVKIWKLHPSNSNFTKTVNTSELLESLSPGVEMYFSVALKNRIGLGPFSAPQIARAPRASTGVLGVPSTVLSGAHHTNARMSRLSLQWTPVNGSEGYIVVATAYNGAGNHVSVTKTVLNSQQPSGSARFKVPTILFFEIPCASRFIFQVAAFNSGSYGNFSKLEEKTTLSTDCETTTTIAAPTDDSELYLYILIGLLVVTVMLLVVGGIVIVCLMHHYCMLLKDKKVQLPDDIVRRGSQSTIRSSVRYIGVASRKLNAETKPDFHKSEDELTSRPLPIPTESDLEEEEEEEEKKIEALRKSVSPPPLPPPVMDLDGGYSTIPNDVRNDIVKGSNNNILMSSSMSQGLLEQGYEFVQSTSTSQLGSQNIAADPTYNIPRSSRHGSHTPVEYEVPMSSRPNTPNMSTLGKPEGTLNQGMKSASAPHALTYDVPPSRNRVLVTGGNVQRSPSPMGTYDVPKNVNGGRLTPSFMTSDNTYDMPRNVSGGFQPPVIVTTPPPGENPPNSVPYIKTPDSVYDVPTSFSAVNEYGYDVLPGRSPIASGRVSPTNPSSSSVRTSTPPIPPREQDNENMYDNLSPVPMNGNLYDTPRSVLASEENLVVSAVGVTKENTETDPKVPVQNDLYDTPRKVLNGENPVISNEDKNDDDDDVDEVFDVDDAALEWKEGVNWELPDPPDDEISTSEGVNEDNSNVPSSPERSPKQKVENPYSRVKRMTGEDGVRTKVTVVDDEPQVVEDPTSNDCN